jgi:uncharacterized protein YndB with AHSA1/START domain
VTWADPVDGTPVAGPDLAPSGPGREPSQVAIRLHDGGGVVRLTVEHDGLANEQDVAALLSGWAAVLANLKTYLETGRPLPRPPWELLDGFVRG